LNTTLTGAPSSGYVFGDHDSFGFEAGSVVLGNDLIVSLSDFLTSDDEVDVISGVNDIVATVFISTTRNVGNLRIEFDTEFLELLDAEFLTCAGFRRTRTFTIRRCGSPDSDRGDSGTAKWAALADCVLEYACRGATPLARAF
jgi:hypothetical protein